jgi:hypothetical protein
LTPSTKHVNISAVNRWRDIAGTVIYMGKITV